MCPISVGYLIPWGSGFKMEVTSQPGLFRYFGCHSYLHFSISLVMFLEKIKSHTSSLTLLWSLLDTCNGQT